MTAVSPGGALAPTSDLSGAILSRRYKLVRPIGTGGMGSVYEANATDPADSRSLAVKVLGVEWMTDDEIKARFVDEGRMCQRLIHPNIVRVFDVAEAEDGSPYIVMEKLEGVPLSAYTRSGVRVPIHQAAPILQGILAGLGAAHAQGVVHRDLKPENVFLAREANGAFSAKILDFGIAKVMDLAGGMGQKTKTGALLGTPAYMSPEQIKNAKDVDARADLWSAGVMLYEMLTGRIAFPAPTEYARLAAVLNTTPAPIDQIDPGLSRLAAFVLLAMQKDRSQRYPSALEMARALSAAMGDGGAGATSTSAASPAVNPGQPLSRLPDVPSVFMTAPPMVSSSPSSRASSAHEGAKTMATPPPNADPSALGGPNGTLASSKGKEVTDPPLQVVVASGTLPSENLPMLSPYGARRGVAPAIVAVLVVVALASGFLLGLAAARLGQ